MAASRALRRWALRFVVASCLLPLAVALYLCCAGFPRPLRARLQRAVAETGLCLEMERARLDLTGRVAIDEPRIYQIGQVGPAVFEAERLVLTFDCSLRPLRKPLVQRLRSVRVKGGRLAGALKVRVPHRTSADPSPRIAFAVSVEKFDLKGLWVEYLDCMLTRSDDEFRVDGITARIGRGKDAGFLRCDVGVDNRAGTYWGRAESMVDPHELVTVLRNVNMSELVDVIRGFDFPGPSPLIEAEFSGKKGDDWRFSLKGAVSGRRFAYHGVDVLSARTPVVIELGKDVRTTTLTRLDVTRQEGTARAAICVDTANKKVSFEGRSELHPVALARLIHPTGPEYVSDYRFEGRVRCSASGVVSYVNAAVADVWGEGEALRMGIEGFTADRCSFSLRRSGREMIVTNLNADILGGSILGWAHFFPEAGSTGTHFRVNGTLTGVDFGGLSEALVGTPLKSDGNNGRAWGELDVSGQRGNKASVNGRGAFRVSQGQVLRLSLFGGLLDRLAENVPGVDYIWRQTSDYVLRQTDAYGDFTIEKGRASTDDIRIEGDVLSVKADGSYRLDTSDLDFDVELRFLKHKTFVGGVLQWVMLPITKMFRFRLRGQLADPQWSSVNF